MQLTGGESGMIRRGWLLLLPFALGLLLAAHATGLTLTAQDQSVPPNGKVVVSIVVADAQDLGGVALVVIFDPAVLRFESAAPGSLAARAEVSSNQTAPGQIAITVATPRSLTGTGPIATLTFIAIGSADTRSDLGLAAVRAVTVDGDPVPAQVANGTVTVGREPRTPLSPFGAVGALAVAAASLRRAQQGRSRRCPERWE